MSTPLAPTRSPFVVVGVGALFQDSIDLTGFWSDILAGRDLITDVPESHWLVEDYYDPDPSAPDKTMPGVAAFSSMWTSPPSVRVKALREAGLPESKVEEVCTLIGENYQPWQESSFPGLLGNVVAGRTANRFDIGGTNCVTDAACASTFSSLSMAINEFHLHQSGIVIAGGAEAR